MYKYLGLKLEYTYNTFAKTFTKSCAIIARLKHYNPRNLIVTYYKPNINPIIQYGVLVYCCCSYTSLTNIQSSKEDTDTDIISRRKSELTRAFRFELSTVYELNVQVCY